MSSNLDTERFVCNLTDPRAGWEVLKQQSTSETNDKQKVCHTFKDTKIHQLYLPLNIVFLLDSPSMNF